MKQNLREFRAKYVDLNGYFQIFYMFGITRPNSAVLLLIRYVASHLAGILPEIGRKALVTT
jgi:hypothetical protein